MGNNSENQNYKKDYQYTIKSSPYLKEQIEEIKILKNIIPEKVKILKDDPNYIIQIDIEGNDLKNKLFLIIYLNYYYPEKSPTFKITEINGNLSEENKNILKNKLDKYCYENIGFPIMYKLFEICQQFVTEYDKTIKKEKEKQNAPYQLVKLNKYKTINEYPIDILQLKNGYILIINNKNKIIIYDNKFESKLLETLENLSLKPIKYCKYFPSSIQEESDFLYIFTFKEVLIYEVSYLNKKITLEKNNLKINGNIIIKYIRKLKSMSDVIELPQYKDSIYFINEVDTEYILTEYNRQKNNDNKIIINFNKKIIKNKSGKIYRKVYNINSQKFIIASYTLKIKKNDDNYKYEGINVMSFVDSNNFNLTNNYNIKISPLKYSVVNYKDKYLIVSYFNTIDNIINKNTNLEKAKKNLEEEQYNFEDNTYTKIYHNVFHQEKNFQIDDYDILFGYIDKFKIVYDYDSYDNTYYSYDITNHYIGMFNIRAEELVTIIEFDTIKMIQNINNNILCVFEKSKDKKRIEQIANERLFHYYFNDIPIKESDIANNYKRDCYISVLLLNEGFKILDEYYDFFNITCFTEVDNQYFVIGSNKKGIILFKK